MRDDPKQQPPDPEPAAVPEPDSTPVPEPFPKERDIIQEVNRGEEDPPQVPIQ